jgi:ornithine carbamoyltransferase
MPMNADLAGRSLLTLLDYTGEEISVLLELASELKRERSPGRLRQRFVGRTLAVLFEKGSTRTRCSFETAFGEEGGHPLFLGKNDIHLGEKESIEDTARVLGRMCDAIGFRGFAQQTVETLAEYSGVPVYNGLTDRYHPTQVLADLMTIREEFDRVEGVNLVYVGDGRNNVARSLLIGCALMGARLTIVSPPELQLDGESIERCRPLLAQSGAEFSMTADVREGVRGADAVYTDVWISMGEEDEKEERMRLLESYRVDPEVMAATGNPKAVFLHCLPAVRGNEVSAEVIDGAQSRCWDQAENRKHTIKALLVATLPGGHEDGR